MSATIAVTGIANRLQPCLLSPVTKILKDTSLLVITLLSNADIKSCSTLCSAISCLDLTILSKKLEDTTHLPSQPIEF